MSATLCGPSSARKGAPLSYAIEHFNDKATYVNDFVWNVKFPYFTPRDPERTVLYRKKK